MIDDTFRRDCSYVGHVGPKKRSAVFILETTLSARTARVRGSRYTSELKDFHAGARNSHIQSVNRVV